MGRRRRFDGFTEYNDDAGDRERMRGKFLDVLSDKTGDDVGKRVHGYVESDRDDMDPHRYKNFLQRLLEALF